MSAADDAAAMVARALARRAPADRPLFLRELLAHAAAGLAVIEGDQAGSEAVYRLADAMAARGDPSGIDASRRPVPSNSPPTSKPLRP